MDAEHIKRGLRRISGRSKKSKDIPQPTDRPSAPQRYKSVKSPSFAQFTRHQSNQAYPPSATDLSTQSFDEGDASIQEDVALPANSSANVDTEERQSIEPPSEHGNDDFDLDLDPPPPKGSNNSVEGLSTLLFSADYLHYIVQDSLLFTRFAHFLKRHQPHLMPVLLHHLEIQKASKALEYANAVAAALGPFPGDDGSGTVSNAAAMNQDLDRRRQRVLDNLVGQALPAQITWNLVQVVTDAMQRSIRGTQQAPIMRNLIGGLTEVFVLTDPSREDNPIIYASEEFYRMTGYGRDFVIGRNCRFLQGPQTERGSIQRLRTGIDAGEEISEAMLNYRRDGEPFVNLLMVAPLHDTKGKVKYHIGAQVDVTGLVQEGQGLEGFDHFLAYNRRKSIAHQRKRDHDARNEALEKLGELSQMFDVSEAAIVQSSSRSNSLTRDSGYDSTHQSQQSTSRRVLIDDSESGEESDDENGQGMSDGSADWKLASPSAGTGRLPGVYQKYLLVRPAPSFNVIFISHALREIGGLLRKPLFDCISSSTRTMTGLKEAFEAGNPVTGKVNLSVTGAAAAVDTKGKRRQHWISATPLLGSDNSIGVWMVIIVDDLGSSISRDPSSRGKSQNTTQEAKPEVSETLSNDGVTGAETNENTVKTNPTVSPQPDEVAEELGDQQHHVPDDQQHHVPEAHTQDLSGATSNLQKEADVSHETLEATSAGSDTHHGHSPDLSAEANEQEPTHARNMAASTKAEEVQDSPRDSDSNGSPDAEDHRPVSANIWRTPPRPSMPGRMLSID